MLEQQQEFKQQEELGPTHVSKFSGRLQQAGRHLEADEAPTSHLCFVDAGYFAMDTCIDILLETYIAPCKHTMLVSTMLTHCDSAQTDSHCAQCEGGRMMHHTKCKPAAFRDV